MARARELASDASARLRRVAERAGGETGVAMAAALVQMIMDRETPTRWPIADMIDLLEGASAGHDRQADRLLASLRRIEADIDVSMPDVGW